MDSLQRKMALKSLFECQGFKLLLEEIDALSIGINIKQDNLAQESTDGCTLNFINGTKQGVREVRYILDGFKEELEEIAGER